MLGRRQIIAVVITLLATIALGVSAYLTWKIWQFEAVAGCTDTAVLDCDEVLTSRWSKWFGLPVSLLGALTYLGILGLIWPAANRPRSFASTGLFALGLLAVGAAAWFVGLQAVQLQSFCPYCLTIHGCALVIGVLALLLLLDRSSVHDYDQMRSLLGVADGAVEDDSEAVGVDGKQLMIALSSSAVGLGLLMGGQLLVEPATTMAMEEVELRPTEQEPVDGQAEEPEVPAAGELAIATDQPASEEYDWLDERVEGSEKFEVIAEPTAPSFLESDTVGSIFAGGSRRKFQALADPIDLKKMPMLGNPHAKHVLVKMMDYTCKHCRQLHPHLQELVDRYGDQLGIVIYHVPLSKQCNPHVKKDFPGKKYACDYAELAIGVWELAPEKFPEFHEWL
ncbi:MAG: vitamin K epoxide reductase family protein, partial [Bythopirellula sp.]